MAVDREAGALRARWKGALDRIEAAYLIALRAAVLLVATGLILLALWFAVTGLIKIVRSPSSVIEQKATVTVSDVLDSPLTSEPEPASSQAEQPVANVATRNAYQDRLRRYFAIYRTRFEPFRQAEDKQLSRDEFDDKYLKSNDRAASVANGVLDESSDLADLDGLISIMSEAANHPKTRNLLKKYREARKVDVRKTVEKVRTELRDGWDSSSTACEDWYLRPYGCPTVRSVEVPYTQAVTVKEFPKGTVSHAAIFDAYHRRYVDLLEERRRQIREQAEFERQSILDGQVAGKFSLWSALQLAGAFLTLMFFFLLIAIERHQRNLAAMLRSDVT